MGTQGEGGGEEGSYCFTVPEVCLYSSNNQGLLDALSAPEDTSDGAHFNWVSHRGPGPVHLDVGDIFRREVRIPQYLPEETFLGSLLRRSDVGCVARL